MIPACCIVLLLTSRLFALIATFFVLSKFAVTAFMTGPGFSSVVYRICNLRIESCFQKKSLSDGLVFVASDELSLEELLSDESSDVICSVATAPSV